MKNFYLPENTKYLTNNGLKCVSEFTEDDETGWYNDFKN